MKDLALAIFNIFRAVGRIFTLVRNLLFNLVFIAVLLVVLVALFSPGGKPLPERAILHLQVQGDIVEARRAQNAVEKLMRDQLEPESSAGETVLQTLLDTIDSAAADGQIVALLLDLKEFDSAGLDQLQTVGESLSRFKETGKTVVAAGDYYTQSQYFLASYSDKIFLNPMGGVELHGFGVYRLYFRQAMEKLAINYNVFKVGEYKSALEPFTRDDMSAEDRRQNDAWLSALWGLYLDGVATRRNIDRARLVAYTNAIDDALREVDGDTARLAEKTGLVDRLATRDEVDSYLASLAKDHKGKPALVSLAEYADRVIPAYDPIPWDGDKIGLIVAEGNILPGKQPPGFIGGDTLAESIRQARDDRQVKALVLRINSGGGSAFASEVIRQELLLVQKKGKPVVVSMGSVAASGGYWVAADADEIWAAEATITGSIGIFGAIPTFEKTLATVGVRSDGTGTTPLAAGLDLTQPLPEPLKKAIQQAVAHSYGRFLDLVAEARDLDRKKVGELAEGRVYSGRMARDLGLVDKLGGLEEAIEAAARLAGSSDYITEYIAPPRTFKEQLLEFLSSFVPFSASGQPPAPLPQLAELAGHLASRVGELDFLADPRGIYAHCLLRPRF